MWEYERKNYKFRFYSDLLVFLNGMGVERWEIVHYKEEEPKEYDWEITAKVLFKRKKENT